MKLEHNVLEVSCLAPKFYAMVVQGPENTPDVIIKCPRINSKDLSLESPQKLVQGIQKKVKAKVSLKKYDEHYVLFTVVRDFTLNFNPKYNPP